MKSKGMKRLRVAFIVVFLLVIGGTALLCWLSPKKPALESGSACPPVRTALAAIALIENPTAKTYATFGPGAAVFTNVFEHAGLVAVTNPAVPADLVFVSGASANGAICRWKECGATNGILVIHFDVRKKTFAAFQRELAVLPKAWSWRLWFPGRADALVTVHVDAVSSPRPVDAVSSPRQNKDGSSSSDANGFRVYGDANGFRVYGDANGFRVYGDAERLRVYGRPCLADMMDLFLREGLFTDFAHAGIASIASVFASYVGSEKDVMPAFESAKGEVVPECFVTKEVPPFDWIDCAEVDADIRDKVLLEIRSMQVVRRMILEGDILSRDGKMDAAMEKWTKAIKRNPDDPLILERICQLDVNAETFMKVGNFPMAAQCLETMVCLRPKDVQTIRRLARVFTQMGKKDLAAAVNKRADELVKRTLAARLPSPVSRPSSVPVSRLPSHDLEPTTRLESTK